GNPTANPGVEVTWAPEIDISDITALNPTVYPLETITYYVFATDADGCSGIDSMIVTVEKVVDPVGGFSPNSDGVNDEFFIDRIDRFPSAVVKIFNRWGNPIFESAPGYVSPWNGTFQGSKLPVGTYYYIIDLNDDDYKKLITGPVTILK
ncbi:MAG: T9SS type B sorting domain-containing protein, partial [Bacteroidetes bacterium]|nr:T9SS type B sorting domain-containing protein [Bacteroidota bacterium]